MNYSRWYSYQMTPLVANHHVHLYTADEAVPIGIGLNYYELI